MAEERSKKKITRVEGGSESSSTSQFVASAESKGKAKQLRLFAMLAWLVAIGLEILAIFKFLQPPVNMTGIYVVIGANLVLAILGSTLWKKSNRLDPASEKDGFRFFVQNQLGAIMAVLAFLPLVIMIFLNKDMDKKQKGIAGAVAIVALLIAGISGVDFNPPSVEQYTEQTQEVERLNNGKNWVYWTKSGRSYHLYSTCSYINTKRTTEIFEGTVAQARELKNITDLCDRCARQAERENELPADEEESSTPLEETTTEAQSTQETP
jgi:hypothetical protein